MAQKAPGKAHRKGLTLLEVAGTFRDEDAARKWIEQEYWPDGPFCPKCGSFNVQANIKHRTATHRCRDCTSGTTKTFFTLRTGTVMERTRLPYRHWAIAMYLFTTNLEGVSSMKLHREFGSIQKSAWFMLHRLRKAAEVTHPERFSGPAEGDEVAIGGKRRNMSNAKRRELAAPGVGRGSVGKTIVSGVKDRPTKHVRAKVVEATDKPTLEGFAVENTEPDATVYTVEASANEGLPRHHESVKHSASEYVRGAGHQRDRVVLVDAPARLHRHLPQDVAEAPEPICRRVSRAPQRPGIGHHRPDGEPRPGNGGQAAYLRGVNRVQRAGFGSA